MRKSLIMITQKADTKKVETRTEVETGIETGTKIEIEARKKSIPAAMKTVRTTQTKTRSHTGTTETMIRNIAVADEAEVEAKALQKARSIIGLGVQAHHQ